MQRLQQSHRLVVRRRQVPPRELVAELAVTERFEVHRQERDVIADVEVAELEPVAELDAVDDRQRAGGVVEHVDVLRLQVAVPLHHAPGDQPLVEQALRRLDRALHELARAARVRLRPCRADEALCLAVLPLPPGALGWAARERGRLPHHPHRLVERDQPSCEPLGDPRRRGAGRQQAVERAIVGEAAHLHRPLHRLALALHGEAAGGRAHDRRHAKIDIEREAAVKLHLGAAEALATLERELADEAEVDGLLRLVDQLTGEEDVRDMRLPQLDGGRMVGVCGRVEQVAHVLRQRRGWRRAGFGVGGHASIVIGAPPASQDWCASRPPGDRLPLRREGAPVPEPEQHFYQSQRLRLAYWQWGDPSAPPLVLVHGGRDHARSWDRVAQAFAPGYRVVAPDLRGHGDSQWAIGGEYSLRQQVIDLVTLIDLLGGRAAVIGHSLGGQIALLTAGAYPERFEALVAVEGTVAGAIRSQSITPQAMREATDRLRTLERRVPRLYPTLEAARDRMMEANKRLTPEFALHLATYGTRPVEGGYIWKYDDWARMEMRAHDITAEEARHFWAAIACPVLLLIGGNSFARRRTADDERFFQRARSVTVPDAGHWVQHDQFDAAQRTMRALLDEAYPPHALSLHPRTGAATGTQQASRPRPD
ncbi:MAG: alpha/beta hydrolase [Dehalococcoidia bacterium]|nr:alpha/beta hydrolase [Dehalococcoidia bacterium]